MSSSAPESRAPIPAFVNLAAGRGESAAHALREQGSFDVREVSPARLQDELKDAVERGVPRVLVAGGDGTLCSAASVLAGTSTELAVIPAGTLNHFAKFVGVPSDPKDAAAVAAGDRVRAVDVGYVNERLILNTSSVGAYVVFVKVRERLERYLGYKLASLIAFARTLMHLPTFRVELEANGERRVYRTPLVFVGIGERELKLPAPGNRVEGGRRGLHVVVIRRKRRARLILMSLTILARGLGARSFAQREIESFVVDGLTIEMRRPWGRVAIDGEIWPMRAPLAYRFAPEALRVATGE